LPIHPPLGNFQFTSRLYKIEPPFYPVVACARSYRAPSRECSAEQRNWGGRVLVPSVDGTLLHSCRTRCHCRAGIDARAQCLRLPYSASSTHGSVTPTWSCPCASSWALRLPAPPASSPPAPSASSSGVLGYPRRRRLRLRLSPRRRSRPRCRSTSLEVGEQSLVVGSRMEGHD
jgi:hypothetical protein